MIRFAAERGDDEGQYRLGCHYLNGECVVPDPERSIKWIAMAAMQGYEEAAELIQAIGGDDDYDDDFYDRF